MWTLYFPNGHTEEFQGFDTALDRMDSIACSRGWPDVQLEVKDLRQGVCVLELRDTYFVRTPVGTYQIDNSTTCT